MRLARLVLPPLALVLALAGLVLQRRCAPPTPATTRQLFMQRDAWTGRKIETAGALKIFSPGTADQHYALDDDGFRVGVRGLPPAELGPLLGRRVRARGVFVFTEKTGGYLDSPALAPAP